MVAGTPVPLGWINPRYQGPSEAELFGIWKSQNDAASFSAGALDQALKAAGVPNNSPWFTIQIDTLQQTIFAGKPYELFDEPRPTLVLGLIEDQPREQFDKVMKHLPKRRPGHGGRHRQVAEAAGLPSGAQLMLSASRPVAARAPGWMTISIWNSKEGADQFCTDFIAASQAAGVPTTDKAQWFKSMIHTVIRGAG
jgi:hypothetical protein